MKTLRYALHRIPNRLLAIALSSLMALVVSQLVARFSSVVSKLPATVPNTSDLNRKMELFTPHLS
jgi:hypothetical protein